MKMILSEKEVKQAVTLFLQKKGIRDKIARLYVRRKSPHAEDVGSLVVLSE